MVFRSGDRANEIKVSSVLDLELRGVKIVYLQSLTMELIDYVFQAMLPSTPESDSANTTSGTQLYHTGVQKNKLLTPSIVESIAMNVVLKNINLILPLEATDVTSFKLSIPQVGITCDYSFSPIPIRDRESRKAKSLKEYIIVPIRKCNIGVDGVNVYNHEGEELLDRLQLSISVLQPLLDPFHVEEIHKNAFAHDDYPIHTKAKGKD